MTKETMDVERIVREVVRRLVGLAERDRERGGDRVESSETSVPTGGASEIIEERVVTLAVVEKRLAGNCRLVVRRDAIVTPAVRDELRDQGIVLHRVEAGCGEARSRARRLYVAAVTAGGSARELRELVTNVSPQAEFVLARSEDEAIRGAVTKIALGRPTAIWTDRPVLTVCLANRHERVWAAGGGGVRSVPRAIEQMPLNMLVLDARRRDRGEQELALRSYQAAWHGAEGELSGTGEE